MKLILYKLLCTILLVPILQTKLVFFKFSVGVKIFNFSEFFNTLQSHSILYIN